MLLKESFYILIETYSDNKLIQEKFWKEIAQKYETRKRHYHNLEHLENMFLQLKEVQNEIYDMPAVEFALFYHDIIYKVTRKDNEERSALFAVEQLKQLQKAAKTDLQLNNISTRCEKMILATKTHTISDDNDTNLFTDADLSILGQSWKVYEKYIQQIRKEYAIYPDFMYNSGRKKVLEHFLTMEYIYKTKLFREKYENQAKENLRRELKLF